MFADVVWFPDTASAEAARVDRLLIYLVAVCGFVGLLVAVLLIGFAIRYRRRPGMGKPPPTKSNLALETFWTITPLFFFMSFFVWGAVLYFDSYRPPDDAMQVYVVGKQWMWKFQHPEGQREIKQLHVPVGQPVKLLLTSEDVIHSFFVPAFRIHMDVLPGRYTEVWFKATKTGTYHLFCSQYCGADHAGMVGSIIVQEQTEYRNWLSKYAQGSMALEGENVFRKYLCITCHSANGEARAPVLEDLFGRRVALRDGRTVVADENYLRESVYYPGAKIVAGYEDIMPTFRGQVTEDEMLQLIAWMKTLKKGQTPPRVEQTAPPTTTPQINDSPRKP